MPRAAQVGIYDREVVSATQASTKGVWEGRGPKRRNEEERGPMLGKGQGVGSPQERSTVCAWGGVCGMGRRVDTRSGQPGALRKGGNKVGWNLWPSSLPLSCQSRVRSSTNADSAPAECPGLVQDNQSLISHPTLLYTQASLLTLSCFLTESQFFLHT